MSTRQVYYNGTEKSNRNGISGYTEPGWSFSGTDIIIGKQGDGSRHYKGLMDDIRIFNKALSVEETQALMHRRPDVDDPNLVGYWDFDEGQGQIAYDKSGNGNDGVLGGSLDIEDSDPVWVESDAPVGICTLEGIVERNLTDVWNAKVSILEQLYEAIAQEQALVDYMDEKFADRDLAETSKGDVAKAKQKIMGAIRQEEQSGTAVDQSIDKIDDAMDTLGIE